MMPFLNPVTHKPEDLVDDRFAVSQGELLSDERPVTSDK